MAAQGGLALSLAPGDGFVTDGPSPSLPVQKFARRRLALKPNCPAMGVDPLWRTIPELRAAEVEILLGPCRATPSRLRPRAQTS